MDDNCERGNSLSRSELFRVFLENTDELESHTLTIAAPICGELDDLTDVPTQLRRDGLSLCGIKAKLYGWATLQPDVLRIAVRFTGRRYQLGVLLGEHSQERFIEADLEIGDLLRELFYTQPFSAYIFGPSQAESPLFASADSFTMYPARSLVDQRAIG